MRNHRATSGIGRSPRRMALAVVIGFFALVASGCSCLEAPRVVGIYQSAEGLVAQVAYDDLGGYDPFSLYLSQDGGQTWESVEPGALGIEPPVTPETTTPAAGQTETQDAEANFVDGQSVDGQSQGLDPSADAELGLQQDEDFEAPTGELYEAVAPTEACLNDGRCFRVLPSEEVQEQIDGRWETSFTFSDEQRRRMELRDGGCSSIGSSTDLFQSVAVADLDGPQGSGTDETTIVSMGPQGVLVLDADGEWQRVAVGELGPVSISGPSWMVNLLWAPVLLLFLSPVLLVVNRSGASTGRRIGAMITNLLLAGALSLLVGMAVLIFGGGGDYVAGAVVVLVLSATVLLISLAVVLPKDQVPRSRSGRRLDPPPPNGPPAPVEPPTLSRP